MSWKRGLAVAGGLAVAATLTAAPAAQAAAPTVAAAAQSGTLTAAPAAQVAAGWRYAGDYPDRNDCEAMGRYWMENRGARAYSCTRVAGQLWVPMDN
ncbi:hypothetical protein ACTMTJ_13070 [Phytohabitans sp. LJ34]|uniref:hypothetical protein n=1 Tax=Phytohabitans sp. LJ34 TaxID=3452217 RepID=UPI003F8A0F2A